MELKEFIWYIVPIVLLELLAAISGSYYLRKAEYPLKNTKYLVWFLWFTVFVELLGSYAPIAYYSDYRFFGFIKDSVFANNSWWYNIFSVLNFAFFTYYFTSYIRPKWIRNALYSGIVVFLVSSAIYYAVSKNAFFGSESFVNTPGAILLLCSVMVFYYHLLRSELILKLNYFLPFYVSIGVLVFNLTVTPIEQLSMFLTTDEGNEFFLMLYVNVVRFANFLLYPLIVIGFLICSKERQFLY